jgi:hypothetical protein
VITNINGNSDGASVMSGLMELSGIGAKAEKKAAGKSKAGKSEH